MLLNIICHPAYLLSNPCIFNFVSLLIYHVLYIVQS